jgi:ParB-like nuclease domain
MTAKIFQLQPAEPPAHPIAEIFPMMVGEAFDALVNDIRQYGQREPIIMLAGVIIDGRNRLRACRQLGVEPRVIEWKGQGDVAQFIISANLHRRQLSTSQRAMVAAKLANIARGEVGRGRPAIGPQIQGPIAAELLNVGKSTVEEAACVLKYGTEEEIAAVTSGRAAVSSVATGVRNRRNGKPQSRSRSRSPKAPTPLVERNRRVRIHADIWSRLNGALVALTGLPLPAEVAEIIQKNFNRRSHTNDRLSRALNWLEEFNRAHTDAEAKRQQQPSARGQAGDSGDGRQDAREQQAQPADHSVTRRPDR